MYYSLSDFQRDIALLHDRIDWDKYDSICPVVQGGVPVAMALSARAGKPVVDEARAKSLIVDDLIDSGQTREAYSDYDFACLHIKEVTPPNIRPTYFVSVQEGWIHYWWEKDGGAPTDNIARLLQYIGEDANREGLIETPKRVIKAYDYIFSGYKANISDLIKVFEGDGYDEMVLLKDIELYSMCEHHMLPFIGKAHVAYIPDKKVIGISKLARIVDVFSRRLQIQERLCQQITDCLMQELQPKGAACVIEASHLCMRMRGVEKQHSTMTTSSLRGVFLEKEAARQEFMGLIK